MPSNLHWTDKFRIERFVRSVDGHLGDLPGKVRSGHRGDLRANLTAASADGGSRAAIARMGSPRALALEFLEAEYGHSTRRPSWLMAIAFFFATYLLLDSLLQTGTAAFASGLTTADPQITGDYRWAAIPYLLSHVSMSFADGRPRRHSWGSVDAAHLPDNARRCVPRRPLVASAAPVAPPGDNRLIAAHAGLRGNTLTSRCITVHGDRHAFFCCPS